MLKTLTTKMVENVQAHDGARVEYRDSLLPSFGLRVAASRKTFFVVQRVGGRQKRVTLGTYPNLSLSEARDAARKVIGEVQRGSYERPQRPVITFRHAAEEFIAKHAKPRNRGWREAEGLLKKFTKLDAMPLEDVKRSHIVSVLDGMVANGTPIAANKALATVKTMFGWCVDRGMAETHPIAGLKKPAKEKSRDRVLSDAELRRLLQAVAETGYPFGPFLTTLLLTGQRRTEVATMRWSDIDLGQGIWVIPGFVAKNGKAHEVPLARHVAKLLTELPRFVDSDLVFTSNGKTAVSGFSKAKARLDAAMEVTDWHLHDLRRTCASGMARLGVAPHVIEKVLNHSTGQISGVAATYNRHAYLAEKRDGLERWATWVGELT